MAVVVGLLACPAAAAVVILENRTSAKIDFTVQVDAGPPSRHGLTPGDLLPVAAAAPLSIVFDAQGRARRYILQANSIHYFLRRDEKLDLFELPLPPALRADANSRTAPPDAVLTVPVKILADDDEPRVQSVWEKRIRTRLAAASEIFERHCRVRFQVVAVGGWSSDKSVRVFEQSLREFEQKVPSAPARLAIGFTGRFQWVPGEVHLGGTREPLGSHILIREALRQVAEPERLEVLVHELGHFLGAVHTPDNTSVMRRKLADRQSRARAFRIGFDACNTLAMNLLADELRTAPVRDLRQLSPTAKSRLRGIYSILAQAMPDDPAAARCLALTSVP
ncbi:MAG: M12 family metallo-peptidase [Thermoguttaceae bacterium]